MAHGPVHSAVLLIILADAHRPNTRAILKASSSAARRLISLFGYQKSKILLANMV